MPQPLSEHPTLTVRSTTDFTITGDGSNPAWAAAEPVDLTRWRGEAPHHTTFKSLCSPKGLYVLFDCPDERLTAALSGEYQRIYTEDVVEVFLWPDERQPLYFEYEVSPLGNELPLLVPNHNGRFKGWIPWEYEGERRCQRATHVRGGTKTPGAAITGWSAEMFIPFALLEMGMGNVPPTPGSRWRANFYRIDYDHKPSTLWTWSSRITGNFHDFNNFGTLVFA